MQVSALSIYPVKSGRAIHLESSIIAPMGLVHDRQWMIVDEAGVFLTQRNTPQLTQLACAVDADGALTIAVAGHFHAHVPVPENPASTLQVQVWKSTLAAQLSSDDVSQKLSAWLGTPVHLVRFPQAGARLSNPVWAGPDTPVGFADGYPVLIALSASLHDLNAHLAVPVPMDCFRTNIVIESGAAWADDAWRRVRIGTVEFELVKPCDRCLVTTTDQLAGTRHGPEPLTTLAKMRRFKVGGSNGVYFGTNAVPRVCGEIRVGDTVEVLETRTPWNILPEKIS
jgi:uncharacterized protein